MTQTPTEQLNKIRTQGNLRAKKHYDSNKEAINQKRREAYALKRGLKVAPIIEEEMIPEVVAPVVEEIVVETPPAVKAKKSRVNVLPLSVVQDKIKALNIARPATEKKYLADAKRVMEMTGCEDLLRCLKKPKKFIQDILASTQKNGRPYTDNTQKSTFQSLLKVIDEFKLDVNKQPYKEQFELYKIKSMSQNETKRQSGVVPTFEEYLGKSLVKFGPESKEYLLGKLYEEMPVRDDLGLVVLKHPDKTNTLNYLLIRATKMEVVINKHKTDSRYGPIRHVLSKPLEAMMRTYLKQMKVNRLAADAKLVARKKPVPPPSDLLFGASSLSPFLTKTNKTLGYTGGSNLFRHMAATQLSADAPAEQKLALATAMGHSPMVQMAYMRQHKLI